MVVRYVQQPVQDGSSVMSGLTDSLGKIKSGQEIHYPLFVKMQVRSAVDELIL